MCAMLAILGAVITLAIAPLASAIPAAASAVASASPSASGTANATANCIIASPGESCAFNMYGESDTACNSDLVSTVCLPRLVSLLLPQADILMYSSFVTPMACGRSTKRATLSSYVSALVVYHFAHSKRDHTLSPGCLALLSPGDRNSNSPSQD